MNPPPVILCVDDEKVGLRVRSMVLEQNGFRVLQANSGTEGLRLLQAEPVEVAVVDFWLPDMDGAELARRIRQHSPNVRIALLTGSVESLEVQQLNVDMILAKPIFPEDLQHAINDLLHRGSAAA